MNKQALGFTLFDLLISLAILVLITSVAVPSFYNVIQKTKLNAAQNTFLSSLRYARSEAISRNTPISICAVNENQQCSNENHWEAGWGIYDDKNSDNQIDEEEALRFIHELPTSLTLQSNARASQVKYFANGHLKRASGALPMMSFYLCNNHWNSADNGKRFVINATGRVRIDPEFDPSTRCSNTE